MKKLHTFALCALVAPALTLNAGSSLAFNAVNLESDGLAQTSQFTQSSNQLTTNDHEGSQHDQTMSLSRTYLDSVPQNGMHASTLIGKKVHTVDNEDIGSVDDLVIGKDGQVVAVIVSVGGFLGIGQKDVAIGWDNITRSGIADKQELRVDVTRADLETAPEFVKPEKRRAAQATQRDRNSSQNVSRAAQPDNQERRQQTASNRQSAKNHDGMKNRGHMAAVPSNGFHTDTLIGMDVYTSDNESIGSVDDLIIDENGKVVAVIVSVGGFLGIGQKDVAISWDNVTRSGATNDQKLRVNVTREHLKSAPKFVSQ